MNLTVKIHKFKNSLLKHFIRETKKFLRNQDKNYAKKNISRHS